MKLKGLLFLLLISLVGCCGNGKQDNAIKLINPENFAFSLKNGESFQAPEVIHSFSNSGFGRLSRNYHNSLISPSGRTTAQRYAALRSL